MLSETLEMLGNMFVNLFNIVTRIYNHYDVWTLILGAFIIFAIYRFILAPITGGNVSAGKSDGVKKFKRRSDSVEGE